MALRSSGPIVILAWISGCFDALSFLGPGRVFGSPGLLWAKLDDLRNEDGITAQDGCGVFLRGPGQTGQHFGHTGLDNF